MNQAIIRYAFWQAEIPQLVHAAHCSQASISHGSVVQDQFTHVL